MKNKTKLLLILLIISNLLYSNSSDDLEKATKYKDQQKYELAEEYYLKAIEKGNVEAMRKLARMYEFSGYRLGEDGNLFNKYLTMAIEKGDTKSSILSIDELCKIQYYQRWGEKASVRCYKSYVNKGYFNFIQNIRFYKYSNIVSQENKNQYALIDSDKSMMEEIQKLYKLKYKDLIIKSSDEIIDYTPIEELYIKDLNETNVSSLRKLAYVYSLNGKYELAEKYYLEAMEKGDSLSEEKLIYMSSIINKYDSIEKYYLKSIEKGNNKSLANLASIYEKQEKYELAEKYYLLAYENTEDVFNLFLLSWMYEKIKNYDLSEKYY